MAEIDHPQEAWMYLNTLISSAKKSIASSQIDYLVNLIKEDMDDQSFATFRDYMNRIFSILPASLLPYFLESIITLNEAEPYWFIQKLINFLINANRPIYQIKGLQLIQQIKDDSYVPYVIPLIYHSHKPLRKEAIKTIITNPGCAEKIVENDLRSRSENKRILAAKLLRKINPDNIRLALEQIESTDFIERIHAIQVLATSNDRKWVAKITPYLNDPDLSVKKVAIEAISQLGGTKAKKILNQKLLLEDYLPLKTIILEQLKNI
ncbi:MAG: HEAT repeat domain-containing protein [Promethearchaeota archaeon]|nr:MAG: HEAT repeat domain-containing protein [Candidatus Lokiarchaeota archaeon]